MKGDMKDNGSLVKSMKAAMRMHTKLCDLLEIEYPVGLAGHLGRKTGKGWYEYNEDGSWKK